MYRNGSDSSTEENASSSRISSTTKTDLKKEKKPNFQNNNSNEAAVIQTLIEPKTKPLVESNATPSTEPSVQISKLVHERNDKTEHKIMEPKIVVQQTKQSLEAPVTKLPNKVAQSAKIPGREKLAKEPNIFFEDEMEILKRYSHETGSADHLSIACHLFPRLSETNLQFHDISWYYETEAKNQRPILRKRKVKVCVLLKVALFCQERGVRINDDFTIEFCLTDSRPRADNQIVSNLFKTSIQPQTSRLPFLNKTLPLNVLIRSNYVQKEVILRLWLRRQNNDVGRIEVTLLDTNGKLVPKIGRMQFQTFDNYRLYYEFSDFPTRNSQSQADYLPDVLICNGTWIGMLALYRQVACQFIAYQKDNFSQTTWINDLVVATLPAMMENEELIKIFIKLLQKHNILNAYVVSNTQIIPETSVQKFRELYINYIFPFVRNPKFDRTITPSEQIQKQIDIIEKNGPFNIFVDQNNPPLDIFELALHLSSNHALD